MNHKPYGFGFFYFKANQARCDCGDALLASTLSESVGATITEGFFYGEGRMMRNFERGAKFALVQGECSIKYNQMGYWAALNHYAVSGEGIDIPFKISRLQIPAEKKEEIRRILDVT